MHTVQARCSAVKASKQLALASSRQAEAAQRLTFLEAIVRMATCQQCNLTTLNNGQKMTQATAVLRVAHATAGLRRSATRETTREQRT